MKHALQVRSAVTSGNYVLFFRLYKKAPNLSTCLMGTPLTSRRFLFLSSLSPNDEPTNLFAADLCVEKMRYEAVKCMSKSYRPTVPVAFVAQVLGFSSEDADGKDAGGAEECAEWLRAHGATITLDGNGEMLLDSKVTSHLPFRGPLAFSSNCFPPPSLIPLGVSPVAGDVLRSVHAGARGCRRPRRLQPRRGRLPGPGSSLRRRRRDHLSLARSLALRKLPVLW